VLLIGWRPEAVAALRRLGAEVTCVLAAGDDALRAGLLDDARAIAVPDASSAESVLAGLTRYDLRPQDFDVVCSEFEFTLVTAAVLGGSRSPMTPGDALALRDKDLQKRRIRSAGIPVADTRFVVRPGDLARVPYERGVVKPLANSATRGVHAWHGEEERAELTRRLRAEDGPWLAEAWVDGAELHIDGVVRHGDVVFVSVGRYLQNVLSIRDGGVVASVVRHPGRFPGLYGRAREFAAHAMKALGHHDGVFHMEVFDQGDRLVFGECGGRIPGGSFDEMIRLQHGVDLHEEWARAVLDLEPGVAPSVAESSFGDVFLTTAPGTLRSCPSEPEVAAQEGVWYVSVRARPGDRMPDARQASCAIAGTAVVEGRDEEEAADRIRCLARWFTEESVVADA
ncbi:ATP-grasp domain-containing protein, partial [Microbispora bryophytorum]